MFYEPEILISTDKSVLQEIRNPFTHAVCWDPKNDDEFQEFCSLTANFNRMMFESEVPFSDGSYDRARDDYIEPLRERINTKTNYFDQLITPLNASRIDSEFIWHMMPTGASLGDSASAHLDPKFLTAFFSLSEKNFGTSCIPKKHSGKADDNPNYFSNADKSQAVVMPSASVYIIDTSKLVHAAPEKIANDEYRTLMKLTYRFT